MKSEMKFNINVPENYVDKYISRPVRRTIIFSLEILEKKL
jgi:hypothetical protein